MFRGTQIIAKSIWKKKNWSYSIGKSEREFAHFSFQSTLNYIPILSLPNNLRWGWLCVNDRSKIHLHHMSLIYLVPSSLWLCFAYSKLFHEALGSQWFTKNKSFCLFKKSQPIETLKIQMINNQQNMHIQSIQNLLLLGDMKVQRTCIIIISPTSNMKPTKKNNATFPWPMATSDRKRLRGFDIGWWYYGAWAGDGSG